MSSTPRSIRYPLQLSSVTPDHGALYQESLQNPEGFWGDLARRRLKWFKEFDQVMECDMDKGEFKWFIGGVINVSGKYYKAKKLRSSILVTTPLLHPCFPQWTVQS